MVKNSNNTQNTTSMSEHTDDGQTANSDNVTRQVSSCKFMTNLFITPKDKTRYIEQLQNFVQDPQIAYRRIFISVGLLTLTGVITIYILLSSEPGELMYTGLSLLLLCTAVLILIMLYVIPTRNKSALASAMNLIMFKAAEKTRAKATSMSLYSAGVKQLKPNGLITFDNNDAGFIYSATGVLGLASLPVSVQFVTDLRANYLIERDESIHETLVTSVVQEKFVQQRKYYASITSIPGTTQQKHWRIYMAQLNQQYVNDITNDSLTLKQYIILRAPNTNKLYHAAQTFEQYAANGGLARIKRLPGKTVETILKTLYMVDAAAEEQTIEINNTK